MTLIHSSSLSRVSSVKYQHLVSMVNEAARRGLNGEDCDAFWQHNNSKICWFPRWNTLIQLKFIKTKDWLNLFPCKNCKHPIRQWSYDQLHFITGSHGKCWVNLTLVDWIFFTRNGFIITDMTFYLIFKCCVFCFVFHITIGLNTSWIWQFSFVVSSVLSSDEYICCRAAMDH